MIVTREHKIHLWGEAHPPFRVHEKLPARLFVGRLGFTLVQSQLEGVEITHKPTQEMESLFIGHRDPYSRLKHTSTPLDLYAGEQLIIHRATTGRKGIIVVDQSGYPDMLRTDCFATGPFADALKRDDMLSHDRHATVSVDNDFLVTVRDHNSTTGTHLFYTEISG